MSKTMRNLIVLGWVLGSILIVGLSPQTAVGQEMPVTPPTDFAFLFPQPGGKNAYEDWVMAGDVIRGIKDVDDALDAPLTFKRRMLTIPAVQKSLALFREGMEKPLDNPHRLIDENTRFPEMAQFRRLARLLGVQIYVQCADGRTDAAIDTFALGLHFGQRVQTNTLISGLVGIAIQAIVIKAISTQLDKFSEYQCRRVRRIVEDWQEWPSPVTSIIALEKQMSLRMIERKRTDLKALTDLLDSITPHVEPEEENDPNSESAKERKRLQSLIAQINARPAMLGNIIDVAEQRMQLVYDHALVNSTLPAKQRTRLADAAREPNGEEKMSPGEQVATSMLANLDQVINKYDDILARMRFVGVRAAIDAYRWEFSRLPSNLTELHLGKLAIDPLTGAPFGYKRTGDTFELVSADPNAR